MNIKETDSGKNRFLGGTLPLLGAIFMAIASVVYIMYKSWSNKAYAEKWKDYDECGI
ncbi:MAG: hypothetical protein IJX77_00050 [Ruminococcus sp.]|nr:hypothetical protein [Ruminococcus sp.]